jgi:hypothetical protein
MFRKGGITNQGSGILSHVEPRPVTGYQPIPKMPIPKLGFEDGGRAGYSGGGTGAAGGQTPSLFGMNSGSLSTLINQNSTEAQQTAAIQNLMNRSNSNPSSLDEMQREMKQWVSYGTRYGRSQPSFPTQFTHPILAQGSGIPSLGSTPRTNAAVGGRIGLAFGANEAYRQNYNDINWNVENDPYGIGTDNPIYNETAETAAKTTGTSATTAETAAKTAEEANNAKFLKFKNLGKTVDAIKSGFGQFTNWAGDIPENYLNSEKKALAYAAANPGEVSINALSKFGIPAAQLYAIKKKNDFYSQLAETDPEKYKMYMNAEMAAASNGGDSLENMQMNYNQQQPPMPDQPWNIKGYKWEPGDPNIKSTGQITYDPNEYDKKTGEYIEDKSPTPDSNNKDLSDNKIVKNSQSVLSNPFYAEADKIAYMKQALDKLMPDTSKNDIAQGIATYFGTAGGAGNRARALNEYLINKQNQKNQTSKANTELAAKLVESYNQTSEPTERIKTLNSIFNNYMQTPEGKKDTRDPNEIKMSLWKDLSGEENKNIAQAQRTVLVSSQKEIQNALNDYNKYTNKIIYDKDGKPISYIDPTTNKTVKFAPIDISNLNQSKNTLNRFKSFPNLKEITGVTIPEIKADGGRIGYADGGRVYLSNGTPDPNKINTNVDHDSPRGFTNLRAKLPPTISNEVVRLLSGSDQAYLDFANIERTGDVAKFNENYGTDLSLPTLISSNQNQNTTQES